MLAINDVNDFISYQAMQLYSLVKETVKDSEETLKEVPDLSHVEVPEIRQIIVNGAKGSLNCNLGQRISALGRLILYSSDFKKPLCSTEVVCK